MQEVDARFGPCCCVDNDKNHFHVLWGSVDGSPSFDYLQSYDHSTRKWIRREWDGLEQQSVPPVEVGASCVVIGNKLYSFGGFLHGRCNASVYELDLKVLKWKLLECACEDNLPLLKNKAGMVDYGPDMLCVFGGYGYPKDGMPLQPGAQYLTENVHEVIGRFVWGWTNEIHLFHLKERVWIVPKITGVRPPPCAAFSFNRIDYHRVLLFGGRQQPTRVSDIHILDLATWHWTGPISQSGNVPWPIGRSFHTACTVVDPAYIPLPADKVIPNNFDWLPWSPPDLGTPLSFHPVKQQRLVVLWGQDNDTEPLSDGWVLNLTTMSWEKLSLPKDSSRVWHCSGSLFLTPDTTAIISFGGSLTNLFREDAAVIPTSETALLEFGILSLQDLCMKWLLGNQSDITTLQFVLPTHLYKKLTNLKYVCSDSNLKIYSTGH